MRVYLYIHLYVYMYVHILDWNPSVQLYMINTTDIHYH